MSLINPLKKACVIAHFCFGTRKGVAFSHYQLRLRIAKGRGKSPLFRGTRNLCYLFFCFPTSDRFRAAGLFSAEIIGIRNVGFDSSSSKQVKEERDDLRYGL
jgi:hypothetical protein